MLKIVKNEETKSLYEFAFNKTSNHFNFLPYIFIIFLYSFRQMTAHTTYCTPAWQVVVKLFYSHTEFWPEEEIKYTKKEEEIYFRKLEWGCGVSGVVAFYCLRTQLTILIQLSLSLQYHSVAGR